MNKEFLYCENPDADIPKMFIDNEIGGKNADGSPNLNYIQGNEFLKELLYLSDLENKSKIEVWINSPGGVVGEGQSIYAAALASKAEVDTVCYGLAASIAGVIFQAGKVRKMFSNAHLMYHPAYSQDGTIDKGLKAANESVCIMIAKRTGKTEDDIWAIMNRGKADDKGSWIGAEEALANGFCDVIIDVSKMNKKDYHNLINRVKVTVKKNKMSKILNKALGLHEEASEESAAEVLTIMNKTHGDLKKELQDTKDAYEKAKKELADFKAEMAEKEAKNKAEAEMKAKEEAEKKAKADADALDKECDEEMENAVTKGKIKNDAELIKTYKAMYKSSPEKTKALIEKLPINKTSPSFVPDAKDVIKDSPAEAAVRAAGINPTDNRWFNKVKEYQIQNKCN
jgi:ATP-dependent protease ClpP protease subunit